MDPNTRISNTNFAAVLSMIVQYLVHSWKIMQFCFCFKNWLVRGETESESTWGAVITLNTVSNQYMLGLPFADERTTRLTAHALLCKCTVRYSQLTLFACTSWTAIKMHYIIQYTYTAVYFFNSNKSIDLMKQFKHK